MIVNAVARGWQIIYHHAHALVAAQLAAEIKPALRPDRWVELLEAIAFHDDEQVPFDRDNYLNEAGAPLDFTQQPLTLEQAVAVSRSARYKSRRVALLICQHMLYLYEPMIGTELGSPDLETFIREQRDLLDRLTQELSLTPTTAEGLYQNLRWCDQVSLYLCQDRLPPGGFALETGPGFGHEQYLIRRVDEGPHTVTLYPWPFAGRTVEVYCETRTLTQMQFADDQELLAALDAAPVEEVCFSLRPGKKADQPMTAPGPTRRRARST